MAKNKAIFKSPIEIYVKLFKHFFLRWLEKIFSHLAKSASKPYKSRLPAWLKVFKKQVFGYFFSQLLAKTPFFAYFVCTVKTAIFKKLLAKDRFLAKLLARIFVQKIHQNAPQKSSQNDLQNRRKSHGKNQKNHLFLRIKICFDQQIKDRQNDHDSEYACRKIRLIHHKLPLQKSTHIVFLNSLSTGSCRIIGVSITV